MATASLGVLLGFRKDEGLPLPVFSTGVPDDRIPLLAMMAILHRPRSTRLRVVVMSVLVEVKVEGGLVPSCLCAWCREHTFVLVLFLNR